MLALASVFCLD